MYKFYWTKKPKSFHIYVTKTLEVSTIIAGFWHGRERPARGGPPHGPWTGSSQKVLPVAGRHNRIGQNIKAPHCCGKWQGCPVFGHFARWPRPKWYLFNFYTTLQTFLWHKLFLCPRHSKNGGEALSVTPVRSCVRSSVRPLSKFGVRSITFERLHRLNSNLVCWYIISKHRSSSIWVTIHRLTSGPYFSYFSLLFDPEPYFSLLFNKTALLSLLFGVSCC